MDDATQPTEHEQFFERLRDTTMMAAVVAGDPTRAVAYHDAMVAAHDEQVRQKTLREAAQIADDMPVVFDDTAYQAQEKIAAAIRAAAERGEDND